MVRAKKHLGQHFLTDKNIAANTAAALDTSAYDRLIEVGPGTGFLTDFLLDKSPELILIEKDGEAYEFLRRKYAGKPVRIIHDDFLKISIPELTEGRQTGVIGNFPYNISTQIMFKILENKELIPEMVGMFQKEVAERIAAREGSKTYGILSVLTRLFYEPEILFNVSEKVFHPPPKVKSAVIRLRRKDNPPQVDYRKLKHLVKSAFNQRRKTLRNSLKNANLPAEKIPGEFLDKRPEALSPEDFLKIYHWIYGNDA
ncbi:MAG: ribosomal RNA small subunit methyltransferase A [Chlorobi bacterium]|nr:ribosomal RNA small subunit methyltransferase A [Chlorobiota bacterium]